MASSPCPFSAPATTEAAMASAGGTGWARRCGSREPGDGSLDSVSFSACPLRGDALCDER